MTASHSSPSTPTKFDSFGKDIQTLLLDAAKTLGTSPEMLERELQKTPPAPARRLSFPTAEEASVKKEDVISDVSDLTSPTAFNPMDIEDKPEPATSLHNKTKKSYLDYLLCCGLFSNTCRKKDGDERRASLLPPVQTM